MQGPGPTTCGHLIMYDSGIEMNSLGNVGNVRYQVWLDIFAQPVPDGHAPHANPTMFYGRVGGGFCAPRATPNLSLVLSPL